MSWFSGYTKICKLWFTYSLGKLKFCGLIEARPPKPFMAVSASASDVTPLWQIRGATTSGNPLWQGRSWIFFLELAPQKNLARLPSFKPRSSVKNKRHFNDISHWNPLIFSRYKPKALGRRDIYSKESIPTDVIMIALKFQIWFNRNEVKQLYTHFVMVGGLFSEYARECVLITDTKLFAGVIIQT